MSHDSRIIDLQSGHKLKPHQAQARIDAGVARPEYRDGKWYAISRCTWKEISDFRAKKAHAEALRHLEPSEIHGLTFRTPESAEWLRNHAEGQRQYAGCLRAAREFVQVST